MEHIKTYNKIEHQVKDKLLIIEGPISSSELARYEFHPDLNSFRPAPNQLQALMGIADLPDGRIIIAREQNTIIGYVTYLYPDPLERWSTFQMTNLIELGAIEVIPDYRGGKLLLISSMFPCWILLWNIILLFRRNIIGTGI